MSPIFTFILSSNIPLSFPITSMLISRHIMPSEVSDGQEDEHCCVDAGREQKGHKVQFHLRVIRDNGKYWKLIIIGQGHSPFPILS